jgi:hypothetical protein
MKWHPNTPCKHCGRRLESHCASGYFSTHYDMYVPLNYCPGPNGRTDWDKGPGTIFFPNVPLDEERR